jgi:hypothetical protein
MSTMMKSSEQVTPEYTPDEGLPNENLINTKCCRAVKGMVSWINARMSRLKFLPRGEPHHRRERVSVRPLILPSSGLRWLRLSDSRPHHVHKVWVVCNLG